MTQIPRNPWALIAFVVLVCLGLTGCGTNTSPAAPEAASSTDLPPEAIAACQELFARENSAALNTIVIIMDNTASRADQPLPEALNEDLRKASLDDGSLSVIAVDGANTPAHIVAKNVALSTEGDRDRPSVLKMANRVPTCVNQVLLAPVSPSASGTDVHAAMALSAEIVSTTLDPQSEATVWVLSDMASTVGPLALTETVLRSSAAEAGHDAGQAAPLDLGGATLKVSGVGNTATPLPLQTVHRAWLRDYTDALCETWGASGCADISIDPVNSTSTKSGLPADELPAFPTVSAKSTATTCTFTLPDALLFAGGSADLLTDADAALKAPLQLLTRYPDSRAVVTGHTASSGGYTAQQLLDLGQERADAIAGELFAGGVNQSRVSTATVADTQPLAEDIDPATGHQIPDIAAKERRVTLLIQGAPCDS